MSVDFGLIAWHEDGRWDAAQILTTRDIGAVMDSLKAQQTNGGAIALIAIEDEFVIIARALGDQMQMMISDVTYALDYEVAAELIEVLDLEESMNMEVEKMTEELISIEEFEKLQNQIEKSTSPYEKEKLQERLAKLAGGVAVLYVGAASEIEMKEKKDRVDDALHATRAAVEEGIVAGGGVALVRAQKTLEKLTAANLDEVTGIQIVSKAIEAPLRTIVENAGGEGSVVINKVLEGKGDFGYDAKNDAYVDMLKTGIIDPKKVTRVALENAASVAGMILTTECALIDIKEDAPPMPPMGGGGMPGMM